MRSKKGGTGFYQIIWFMIGLVMLSMGAMTIWGAMTPSWGGKYEYFCTHAPPGEMYEIQLDDYVAIVSYDWKNTRIWGDEHHEVSYCPPISGPIICPCIHGCNYNCDERRGFKYGGKMVVGLHDYDPNNPDKKPYRCVCKTKPSDVWYCRGGALNAEWTDSMDPGRVYGTEVKWCSDPFVNDNEQACDDKCTEEGFDEGKIVGTKRYSIRVKDDGVKLADWDTNNVEDDFSWEDWYTVRRCECVGSWDESKRKEEEPESREASFVCCEVDGGNYEWEEERTSRCTGVEVGSDAELESRCGPCPDFCEETLDLYGWFTDIPQADLYICDCIELEI